MNNRSSGGTGFLGILQIVFIVLKLCNIIHWSWVIVLIPLWVDLGVIIFFLAVILADKVGRERRRKKRRKEFEKYMRGIQREEK